MLTDIQKVRYEIGDTDPSLPILNDTEIEYFLEKNNYNLNRTCLDAARVILFKLSQRGEETVDIFSIKGNKSAEQYRLALQMYIKDPNLNPVLQNVRGYVGGVSKSDMEANDAVADNNVVPTVFPNPTYNGDPFNF